MDNYLPRTIASQIVTDIVNNKLQPGEKVIEERYASIFGTSRGPVREALFILETEGMIERIPQRGAFVKKYNPQDLCDLFEIRISLEMMALDRLKFPLPDSSVKEIDAIIMEMETADPEKYAQLNNDFHYKMLSLSNNEVIKNMYSRLGTPLIALQKLILNTTDNVNSSYEAHKMLWNAVKKGQLHLAKAVLADHLEDGKRRYFIEIEKNS